MGQQVCCFEDPECEEEPTLTKEKEWEPMGWEIREWYTELRENDITMHEHNIKRDSQRKIALEEQETEKRRRREQEIIDRENELAALQRELEAKELELEEKAALLEIAIRVNELSIETRYGGLERRLEELQIASKLRRTQNMEIKRGSINRINNLCDDESSSDSEESS